MMICFSFLLIFHNYYPLPEFVSPTCLPLSAFLPVILTSQVCIYSQQMGSPMTDTRSLSFVLSLTLFSLFKLS